MGHAGVEASFLLLPGFEVDRSFLHSKYKKSKHAKEEEYEQNVD